jgi:hypothetical protein
MPKQLHRFLAILVGSSIATTAYGTPKESVVAFDGYCIGTGANVRTIENMALGSGGSAVPRHLLSQDAAVARHGGKGFNVFREKFRFTVIVTTIGSCSVLVPSNDVQEVRRLIEKSYPLGKPFVETAGPQVFHLYRIKESSANAGGYISLTAPKAGFDEVAFVAIGFISPRAAQALGMGQQ